jgi:hypothetical protein
MGHQSTSALPAAVHRFDSTRSTLRLAAGVALVTLWLAGVGALVFEILEWYAELVALGSSGVPSPWWDALR